MNNQTTLIWSTILLIPTLIFGIKKIYEPSDNYQVVGKVISSNNNQKPINGVQITIEPLLDSLARMTLIASPNQQNNQPVYSNSEGVFTIDLGENIFHKKYLLKLQDPNNNYKTTEYKVFFSEDKRKRKEDIGTIMLIPDSTND